jgi:poly-gamma-glutamate synthesis protein (capsule biosynthesis protein)
MRRCDLFLGILALLSLPLPGLPVAVEAPAELKSAWERLLFSHPFPPGLDAAPVGTAGSVGSVILRDRVLTGFRIVDESILVPVMRLWDPPLTLTRAQAESRSVRLLTLDSVALPDIALPVDGLYPGDPGYPLMRRVAVGIQGDDPVLRQWFETLPDLLPRDPPERFRWIGAVGDIMPDRGVDAALLAPAGAERVFGDTLPLLRSLDLLVGNLEAAATTGGVRAVKTYTFRFDPRALGSLAAAGFSYLSAANNHTFDYGMGGFIDTLASLGQAGIATSGAGRTAEEASRPAVMRIGDVEVRLLSFAAYPVDRTGFDGRSMARATADRPGALWLDDEGIAAAARGFSTDAFNVALVHGGIEWSSAPTEEQRRRYRDLIRAGADLVIGSHPHVLQGLEAVDGRLIAYSLGNFLFPGMEETPGGERSAILEVGTYGRRIVSLRVVPVRLDGGTVRLELQKDSLRELRSQSRDLNASPRADSASPRADSASPKADSASPKGDSAHGRE